MKSRFLTLGAFCISVIFFTACNQNDAIKQADAATVTTSGAATAVKLDSADEQFATAAATGGMVEVELGIACATQAQNQQVKDFGNMMVDDHTQMGNALGTIATNKNLMLPATINKSERQMVADMERKSGNDFDRAYMDMMILGHEAVIKEFKREASDGKDADLSAFAARTLPIIQKHLNAAKAVRKAV